MTIYLVMRPKLILIVENLAPQGVNVLQALFRKRFFKGYTIMVCKIHRNEPVVRLKWEIHIVPWGPQLPSTTALEVAICSSKCPSPVPHM